MREPRCLKRSTKSFERIRGGPSARQHLNLGTCFTKLGEALEEATNIGPDPTRDLLAELLSEHGHPHPESAILK